MFSHVELCCKSSAYRVDRDIIIVPVTEVVFLPFTGSYTQLSGPAVETPIAISKCPFQYEKKQYL